jgi:hypothetical protein
MALPLLDGEPPDDSSAINDRGSPEAAGKVRSHRVQPLVELRRTV